MDLLVIHPGAQHGIYGALGDRLTALEPPSWARMIAGYCRDRGVDVAICDAEALALTPEQAATFVADEAPALVAIVASGHQPSASTQQMVGAGAIARAIKKVRPGQRIIMTGNHPSALPERTLREEAIDFVADGEGPITIQALLERDCQPPFDNLPGLVYRLGGIIDPGAICRNPSARLIENLDADLHGCVWDLLPMDRYRAHNWQMFGRSSAERSPYASIYTSLGCPYKCLAGDTMVDTIYGKFPIAGLVRLGVEEIPVFTFDPETKRGLVATAKNIRCYGRDRLVRVRFDDGTHVDCTPDHRFLQFGLGNGKSASWQRECEAKNLQPGAHVRAIRFSIAGPKGDDYPTAAWSRRGRESIHRMVASWKEGRPLKRIERVHHVDHDRANWLPDNLEVCVSQKDHSSRHPEISDRMRKANPAFEMKYRPDWIEKIEPRDPTAVRGKPRGLRWWTRQDGSTYQAIAAAAVGDEVGRKGFNAHRRVVNHRVTSVEPLPGLHDVYCLEVPETGWFYANDVLVSNCSFCMINAQFHTNRYRTFSPIAVASQVRDLYRNHDVRTFKIADEMFVLNPDHYLEVCDHLAAINTRDELNIWAYARVDTVRPDNLSRLRAAGIRWLALGIESGNAAIRDGANKALRRDDIVDTVRTIQAAGISVIGNFMFGLPGDTAETMQETLDLALAALPEFANFYSTMAYPGSRLYDEMSRTDPKVLPTSWRGYSQHNDECTPLPTEVLTSAEILRFRDEAFRRYFTDGAYRLRLVQKFGHRSLEDVDLMLTYSLSRRLLGNNRGVSGQTTSDRRR